MDLCVCGQKFGETRNLRRHERACRILKEHDRRVQDAGSNNNWQHPDIDSDDDSDLFMGITRRKKKSKKSESASINNTVKQEIRDAPDMSDMGLRDNAPVDDTSIGFANDIPKLQPPDEPVIPALPDQRGRSRSSTRTSFSQMSSSGAGLSGQPSPFVSGLSSSTSPAHTSEGYVEDNDNARHPSDEEHNTSVNGKSNDYLTFKGRIIGRFLLMWDNFSPILEEGLSGCSGSIVRRRRWEKEYQDLVNLAPIVPDFVRASGGNILNVSVQLERARSQARSADVSSVKRNVHRWYKFDPQIDAWGGRHLLGFNHPITGRMLCPIDLDWDDVSVRQMLQDGTQRVNPTAFPRFLWKDERASSTDFFHGFMQGKMVLSTYLHIFVGPSAVLASSSNYSTRKGNAALHGIQKVNLYSIAYAATIFRFVISGQTIFSQGGHTKGRWPYKGFYNELIRAMKGMEHDDLQDLIGWWQDTVFGGIEDNTEGEDDGNSVAAQMRAQAAEKRAQKTAEAAARQ